MSSQDDPNFVASLSRGLAVLRAFSNQQSRLTLTEVTERVGFSKAAVRRFLHTLKALNYVESDGKYFWLTPVVLELANAYLTSQPLVELVQPYVEQVSKETGETSSVSVLKGHEVIYVARHLTHHIMSVALNIGTRLPAHYTAMGRAILSRYPREWLDGYLDTAEIRAFTQHSITDRGLLRQEIEKADERGFSLVSEELELGLRSIAVPIVNKRGQVVAAINVGTQCGRESEVQFIERIVPSLQQAAQEIESLLPL